MKKIYFTAIIFAVLLFSLIPNSFASSIEDIIEQQKQKEWYVGKDIQSGDSFTYRICDDKTFTKSIFAEKCYTIQLDFYGLFDVPDGKTWVVQSLITTGDTTRSGIFQISPETLDISTDIFNIEFANSIENTLFNLKKFANPVFPKILDVGKSWGTIPSYLTMDAEILVLNEDFIKIGPEIFDVFTVGYNVKEQSTYAISKEFPFPLRGNVYSPTVIYPEPDFLFSFELIRYSFADPANLDLAIDSIESNLDSIDDFVLIDNDYSANYDEFVTNYDDLICVPSESIKLDSSGSILIDDDFINLISDAFEN